VPVLACFVGAAAVGPKKQARTGICGVTLAYKACVERSAQFAKMTTGITGQKTCILRINEKYDAIWHQSGREGCR
jgi:hypothetical protein